MPQNTQQRSEHTITPFTSIHPLIREETVILKHMVQYCGQNNLKNSKKHLKTA